MQPYWQGSGITIYHCRAEELLPEVRGAIVLTDPPYNAKKRYGEGVDDNRPWPDWCAWWDGILELCRVTAPDTLAFMSQTAYRKYLRLGQYEPDWALAWVKPLAMSVCALPFMPHWEPVPYWGTTRKKNGAFWGGDVLSHNVTPNKWGHPTEKSLPLMLDLVGRFAGPIIDPFAGSGTTLLAAKLLGKTAVGCDCIEKWCEVAVRRLEQMADGKVEQYGFVEANNA